MVTENSLRSVGANGVGTETNGRSTRGKDGLNGGANSLRMMGRSDDSATQQQSFSTWRRLQKSWSDFKVSRETYSMWWFPPEHRYFDFNSIHLYKYYSRSSIQNYSSKIYLIFTCQVSSLVLRFDIQRLVRLCYLDIYCLQLYNTSNGASKHPPLVK